MVCGRRVKLGSVIVTSSSLPRAGLSFKRVECIFLSHVSPDIHKTRVECTVLGWIMAVHSNDLPQRDKAKLKYETTSFPWLKTFATAKTKSIHSKFLKRYKHKGGSILFTIWWSLETWKMKRLRSFQALQNLSISKEKRKPQNWVLRLGCDRRPLSVKMDATDWANPTTIPIFTWPLLGIGRPESACEKLPRLIMDPPAPSIVSEKIERLLMRKLCKCKGKSFASVNWSGLGGEVRWEASGLYRGFGSKMPLVFCQITIILSNLSAF